MNLLRSVLPGDHYRPHPYARFEGYYSKFDLPSGARLVFIICSIPNAPGRKHYISMTYVPKDGRNVWQKELFPERNELVNDQDTFRMSATNFPAQLSSHADVIHYNVEVDGISFNANSSRRIPWSSSWTTPEAYLAWLPLPLHWHVQSLGSQADFTLSLPADANMSEADRAGQATVHEEKNWANSFPSAHNWIQGRKAQSNICLAGGRTLGMDAFLVGYRNKELGIELDFRPPFALRVFGLSLFMDHRLNWEERSFCLVVQDFFHKMEITATAPEGTFFAFSSPMPQGFVSNYMGESLNATVTVKVYQRSLPFARWHEVCSETFSNAALEFGGSYYPLRGTDQTIN